MLFFFKSFSVSFQFHSTLQNSVRYSYGPIFPLSTNMDSMSRRKNSNIIRYGSTTIIEPIRNKINISLVSLIVAVVTATSGRIFNLIRFITSKIVGDPSTFISIPFCAALVGYITNWVGVKMLFYPIEWTGIPIQKWPDNPLGLIGWQGVVPTKRFIMSTRLVEVTISQLLKVKEVFSKLDAVQMANLLVSTISPCVLNGCVPKPIVTYYLKRTSQDIIREVESVVDIKSLVVSGLSSNPAVLGTFFQTVARKELAFLVDSGFGFGFLLGVLQMIQWALFPAAWTLPVGGALVGYITNWIALKWIFEPLNPTKFGPFTLQGMFLKRQKEVSADFCEYLSRETLPSIKVWNSVFENSRTNAAFENIVRRNLPFLPNASIKSIMETLRKQVGLDASHPIHGYTNKMLDLRSTLTRAMNRLTPAQFEKVLHPVFEEDEITLIVAGAVLGAISGLLQLYVNSAMDRWRLRRRQLLITM